MPEASLPPNFEWGFSTAAYQIEGGAGDGGRGPSIWDTFTHLEPSRTNNANGDVACDHYHLYESDFDLLTQYGAKTYRFSFSWSRLIPLGGRDDPVNEEGVRFYNNLIDSLLRRGIVPWVTLYHWDLPQGLEDRYGGWLNVDEVQLDFERYARLCFERFGDRVKNWITFNEPWIQAVCGYAIGRNAPGRSSIDKNATPGDSTTEPWIAGKAQIMSHARAALVYGKDFKHQEGRIGIALNGDFYLPWDAEDPKDHEAAERRMEWQIGWWADPIYLKQDYPESMRKQLGDRLPRFTDADFAILRASETHFYGMNYYTAQFARHRPDPVPAEDFLGAIFEHQEDKLGNSIGEVSGIHWLRSRPDVFSRHLKRVYALYKKPIYITENGCPCPGEDKMTKEESVQDEYRLRYFTGHLDALCEAVKDGVDVRGYFAWSLLDNLEWADGYGPRFGVTYTDYETLERTPKNSALTLKKLFAERGVVA
ncbi:Beta-glucosidase 1B [Escovopsis weberi]|uniref:beta-glucosidase n=1 Tax=Escovopsis weberi TaxID=150374 RepID=A0A0M8MV40_ESCWE|nr:Beta-glucosidase 1B [Escovopsis weberi]